ncbi:MAG TPA: hypothetical protein VIO60_04240 [Rectinemataceae bacterium]
MPKEKIDSKGLVREGLRSLSRHRPDQALNLFKQAVDAIPPSCGEELSQSLYWLSVALARLDRKDLAIKSLASAQKLRRRGFARRVYQRSINEYGMIRRPTPELDDLHAFVNIQLSAYLSAKPRRRFDSETEREYALRLIFDAWKNLKESGRLAHAECGEKLQIFKLVRPGFPYFGFAQAGRTIKASADLFRSPSPAFSKRCPCGSGLGFYSCCGRTRHVGEISSSG